MLPNRKELREKLSLDSPQLIALNSLIACRGRNIAIDSYEHWCRENGVKAEPWAVAYLNAYCRAMAGKKHEPYINVRAAKWALEEAKGYL